MESAGFFKSYLITRDDGRPYLHRFMIAKCRWFGIMVHNFLASDDECLHDHPWWFASVILAGGYWEATTRGRRWYRPGSVLVRRPEHAHRIEIVPGRRTITLVITGPRLREWGFFTRFGWVDQSQYTYAQHCS